MPAEDLTPSPFTETTGTDRHAAVAALRESGPVQRVTLFTGGSVWLVTGYAEVEEQLRYEGPKRVPIRPAVPGTEPGRPPSLLMNGIAALPVTVA
ncbi:hypothetical protein ACWEWP_21610 [Streptomyces olivaceus]